MSSSTNQIKNLVQRFVSLQPAVRMKLTKKLLELYNSEQASRETKPSDTSVSPLLRKSFLEQFWDEVENAHGDRPSAVNPFTQERRSKAREVGGASSTNKQGGYLPWHIRPSDLFALL
ncbi:MAG TPA: hypothetical protein VF766_01300 [Pyrinomonadaceae bacterium]